MVREVPSLPSSLYSIAQPHLPDGSCDTLFCNRYPKPSFTAFSEIASMTVRSKSSMRGGAVILAASAGPVAGGRKQATVVNSAHSQLLACTPEVVCGPGPSPRDALRYATTASTSVQVSMPADDRRGGDGSAGLCARLGPAWLWMWAYAYLLITKVRSARHRVRPVSPVSPAAEGAYPLDMPTHPANVYSTVVHTFR